MNKVPKWELGEWHNSNLIHITNNTEYKYKQQQTTNQDNNLPCGGIESLNYPLEHKPLAHKQNNPVQTIHRSKTCRARNYNQRNKDKY
jgi:hypothetical protein